MLQLSLPISLHRTMSKSGDLEHVRQDRSLHAWPPSRPNIPIRNRQSRDCVRHRSRLCVVLSKAALRSLGQAMHLGLRKSIDPEAVGMQKEV